ncbi:MAG: CFI-box-CTERM domain-containing protein [Acetivibrio sp.]
MDKKEEQGRNDLMENTFDYDNNIKFALENIGSVLLNNTKLMEKFKKKTYKAAFEKYAKESEPVFNAIERACVTKTEEREEIIEKCAAQALEDFKKTEEPLNKGRKKSYLETCKMVLALYTVPMILELKKDISEEYVDCFMEKWMETYPGYVFKKGTYESLMDGFDKKGFCYITTAVMNRQNKSDDCYELMMFRNFRDEYLMKKEQGKKAVKTYYDTAPRILAAIELEKNREDIYQEIWEKHLSKCLKDIENGQEERCEVQSTNMVRELEKRYIS